MLELSKENNIKEEIEKLTKLTKIISFIRFILFIFIIIFVICLLSLDKFIIYLGLSIIFITLFSGCVIFTSPFYHKLKLLKNLELIYKKHHNRRNLSYQSFSPDGRDLIDYKDYKELDLDILGSKSLFQYLCCAKSKEGKAKLAKQLTNPVMKSKDFTNCVANLAKTEDTLRLEASISLISLESKDCCQSEMVSITNKKINISWFLLVICALSCILFGLLLSLFLINNINLFYLLLFIPFNFIISKKFIKTDVFSNSTTKYANLLTAYKKLAKDILEIKIEDKYYKEIQKNIEEEYISLVWLNRIFDMLSYRNNAILSILGNGIFYLDLIIALLFNKFSKKINNVEKCLDSLSEIELLISLAVIGIDNEYYTKPTISNKFKINDGYHPLVKNCIPNSFKFEKGIILTGSNMSGKTTFMRMIGVNQILANAGGIVCAKEFYTNDFNVLTSLRANDMLQEGISTFYAEVNRMKNIINNSKDNKSLILIDEIFKGTNAKDRIYAAKQIIKKLNSYNVYFIISTHDFELCEAEEILNYHFDEEYIDDKITFDYKIKEGICQKTNAIYLLKLAGVLDKE